MFSFLKDLDYRLFERYRTLERNIKSASNSFYDSYLDLQEQFLRIVLESEGVEIKTHKENGNIITYPFLIDTNEHYKLLNNDKQTFEKYQNNGVVFNFKHEDIESSI